jgi:hypothetical protein
VMKAHIDVKSGRLTFEVAGENVQELFTGVAEVQEVFQADACCGCCQGTDLVFRVRTLDGNKFYELFCRTCEAALSYSVLRTGGLFPKRKDYGGTNWPNRGWKVYRGGRRPEHEPDPDFELEEPRK